jgi:putative drug exporter of the RND superfamily
VQLRTAQAGVETLPTSLPVVDTYYRLQRAFPGLQSTLDVVLETTDVNGPAARAAIDTLRRQAVSTGRMHEPIQVTVNDRHTVARITIPIDGTGQDGPSKAALAALRGRILPATLGRLPGTGSGTTRYAVTGVTAIAADSGALMRHALPYVFGFVLLLAFALMLTAFRSIVIAIKAIVLNLLSIGAAYGVLVAVFQWGIGRNVIGFHSTDGIDPIIPIMLFVILFGLSMDYHVFILSRIRELRDRGAATDNAIRDGITSTAGVVTSAAAVMVGVFAVFATLHFLFFKQFGVGLATAVLIDATVIRVVLLPATMKLLGEHNWYLPRWLAWLPQPALD